VTFRVCFWCEYRLLVLYFSASNAERLTCMTCMRSGAQIQDRPNLTQLWKRFVTVSTSTQVWPRRYAAKNTVHMSTATSCMSFVADLRDAIHGFHLRLPRCICRLMMISWARIETYRDCSFFVFCTCDSITYIANAIMTVKILLIILCFILVTEVIVL